MIRRSGFQAAFRFWWRVLHNTGLTTVLAPGICRCPPSKARGAMLSHRDGPKERGHLSAALRSPPQLLAGNLAIGITVGAIEPHVEPVEWRRRDRHPECGDRERPCQPRQSSAGYGSPCEPERSRHRSEATLKFAGMTTAAWPSLMPTAPLGTFASPRQIATIARPGRVTMSCDTTSRVANQSSSRHREHDGASGEKGDKSF